MPDKLDNIMKNEPLGAPPENMGEFYTHSFAEVLVKSIGYFAICEFVVGTSGLVEKSGIIYAAGNNFVTLRDPDQLQYTICDMYSLKFATVFDSTVRPSWIPPNTAGRRQGGYR